ncbi:hypothetical protein SOVF_047500 [Spinacia oleracea]|uniref:Arginine decarboxylase n=1 Tax=Spinacia oleracea TaxID=3562 RepID=A0A9R0IP11_SPIOL|nr:arginine decarboxylase-like [Spinacia oleracea]KNA20891.1 hypothetical protein SOVF_047500 [Spinacia oleracea]
MPACILDASAASTIVSGGGGPPGFAAAFSNNVDYLSLPLPDLFSGVLPSTNSTTITTAANEWSPSHSSSLYRIDRWGPPYFAVNASGNITVKPFGDATLPHQEIDLLKVVKKVSDEKSNGGLGLQFPLIVRFPDVLKHRLESLQCAFDFAVQSNGYGSHYQGVYPVKCNQDRFIVEDIVKFGSGFRFGLEAGSKPELLLAMSCLCKGHPDAFLVCNGFKDAEYIALAIIARKLAINTVIVLEQEEEVDLVIELSRMLGIRPVIGLRAKLRTKHSGHFGSTSGEKGKFGLTTIQILRVVRKLDAVGMLDCLQLLHFHIGSQIPSTTLLSDGVSEGAQVFCELARLGACMRVIDIGGGLGIDYDGSKSTESDISVGYTLDEYASAVVRAVQVVCDRKGMQHPVICSESGRAIVSHHSILVFEAVSSTVKTAPAPISSQELNYLVEGLPEEARGDVHSLSASVTKGDFDACLLYADQLKQRCIEQFKDGCLGMEQLAAVDGLCEMVSSALGVGDSVSIFHVNLSVFTSIPDFWGIGQLFPVTPIHKLEQRPGVRGILSDLTCDSDGKIDKFIGGESSLPLHELRRENGNCGGGDGGYYLGMFLGGAYEEALGGVHNLFGGPSVVRVMQSDGPHSFAVTRAVPGPSSGDVLRVMQHEPELMFETLKHRAEECLPDNEEDIASLANGLARSFNNMPYLVAGPISSSCGFINNNNNVNGYHHPYFCGAEDSCNGNAVEVTNGEDEQWPYVCA